MRLPSMRITGRITGAVSAIATCVPLPRASLRRSRAGFVLTLTAALISTAVHAQGPPSGERWVATWGTAQQLAVETLPAWAEPPVRIGAVRVALRERASEIVAGSDYAVTFGGHASLTISPGALVVSDPVDLAVPSLAELAVSLYLPEGTGAVTTHSLGLNTTYVADGNAVAARALPEAATNRSYFWLSGIEVLAPANAAAIVAFGDSITDGFSTTPDTHRAWPALLAAKLQADPATSRWAVVNMGISGNRIRRDGAGTSGLARFGRDVLARAGVEWIVLLEGINDITFSALPRAPQEERTTAGEIIEALALFVDRTHAHGIRVMGATLTPMGGLWLHNAETEAMRQTVND